MRAIISDVHGNLEAMRAVLADLEGRCDSVFNLGDTVGYGPNPLECIDLALPIPLGVMGNHDYAVVHGPQGFSRHAEQAIRWTSWYIDLPMGDKTAVKKRRDFLRGLPSRHEEGEVLFVHASPHHPTEEYIFPDDIFNYDKMDRIAEKMRRLCFCGHTHQPGIFVETGGNWQFYTPDQCGGSHRLDGRKTICNVGAVGQPRDGDWRSCYVLFDGKTIQFRRVEYDVETTVRKIQDHPELHNSLGDRLREGR